MTALEASCARLKEQKIVVAMLSDGRERICIEGSQRAFEAHKMGAAIWTPEEMLRYVEMPVEERHVYRNLKQSYRASVEFKEST